MIKPFDYIGGLVASALKKLDIDVEQIDLDHPTDFSHGDYATNIALVLSKKLGTNPKALAEDIAKNIPESDYISSISVAGPGFINFSFKPEFFADSVDFILSEGEDYGKNEMYDNKRILVEHSSPNLFKSFHVGHVMNNAIGESITRLAEYSGAHVIKMSYPSDVSLGIGKAVWAFFKRGTDELDKFETRAEKLKFLGECYVEGTKAYDEDEEVQKQVKKITEIIYEKVPGVEYDAYLKGKDINLEYFLDITERLGSNFEAFIFESEAGAVGEKIVRENLKEIFQTSDGAIIYEGEKDGLHTRVFVNKEGYPTYEAKDIGLLSLKFERFNPDISILVTDKNQEEYYKVVLSAAGRINIDWQEKTFHQTHGRMSFKGKKMSSRLGGIPTAAEILDTVCEEVKDRLEDKGDLEKIDSIAISALKFTILKAMAGKNIDFDPEVSLSFEGDSGPYLQYTRARINSILEKAAAEGMHTGAPKEKDRVVTNVEKLLYRFPEVVEQSILNWSPHYVAGFLLELSRAFNSWYGGTKIIDKENVNAEYNLAIAAAVAQTIKNGLYILGIKSPERM